jgi:hypothetical protein
VGKSIGFSRGKPSSALGFITREAKLVKTKAFARHVLVEHHRVRFIGHHRDAIDRASRNAELAGGAPLGQHGMHMLVGANDCIGGAGVEALGAADTRVLINQGNAMRFVRAAARIERCDGRASERRKCGNACVAAGWTAIDRGFTARNGFGVWHATLIPTLRTLGLRQQSVYSLGGRHLNQSPLRNPQ